MKHSLQRLFSSRVRVKILEQFFTQPKSSFYIRQLARLTGEDVKNVSLELQNLETLGLLEAQRQGPLKYYSVNSSFLFYPELKSIFFKTLGVGAALKELLLSISDIELAFIYGSYAKGKETSTSDIDLFIVGKPSLNKLNEAIQKLEERLRREINYQVMERKEFQRKRQLRDSFVSELLKEPKVFLIGGEDELS